MTISSDTNRATFSGNGSTTAFATGFVFEDETDLVVVEINTTTGVETTKTLTTHYTVSGGSGATGTVTMLTAPASGTRLLIYRDPPVTQSTDLVDGEALPAATLEGAYDKLTTLVARLKERVTRALRQPEGDLDDIAALPNVVDRASKYLAFDADGDPVATSGTTSDLVASTFIETLLDDADAATARATLGATGNLKSVQKFTASDTWTKPAGCVAIIVEVVAGGGGGGGASSTAASNNPAVGGGGGAGGYSRKLITSPGATETVTVGAGGTAGANTGTSGGTGGASSFGSHCTATGGSGGTGTTGVSSATVVSGGAGGVGSSGDVNLKGNPGRFGVAFGNSNNNIGSGDGGSLMFGGAGQGVGANVGNAGQANSGAGGSGAGAYNNSAAGGAGGSGRVVVWELY